MTISGLHLLLTYKCTHECDHCFVFGSPFAKGVMTIADIREIYKQAKKLGTVERIFFEGGEPFLYYPIMLRGIEEANDMGFKTGIVTDAYWATTAEDALEWLTPISKVGSPDLSVSEDVFHQEAKEKEYPKNAIKAAEMLGLPVDTITVEEPAPQALERSGWKGKPITEGEVMFRGRAAEKLTEGLPRRSWTEFAECRHEDLANPTRVHIDPFGFIHLCQGLVLGNYKEASLSQLIESYDPVKHPICGPIVERGPAALIEKYNIPHEEGYVDECHLCYCARLALRKRFPKYLAPQQMYGEL